MIWIPNQLIGAAVGHDVTLECITEAMPKAISYWVFNGTMVMTSGRFKTHEHHHSNYKLDLKLHISKVRKEDFGQYMCLSKNSHGDNEGTIQLYGTSSAQARAYGSWRVNKQLTYNLPKVDPTVKEYTWMQPLFWVSCLFTFLWLAHLTHAMQCKQTADSRRYLTNPASNYHIFRIDSANGASNSYNLSRPCARWWIDPWFANNGQMSIEFFCFFRSESWWSVCCGT